MDFLQRILGGISKGFEQLNASQRVAMLLGAVLVAGSLAWLAQWAAKPELTPLLQGRLSSEDIAGVRSGLEAMGETYEVRGDTVYVSGAANQHAILAQLQQMNKLPTDISSSFAALIKQSNPFVSQAESDRLWTVALQEELQKTLGLYNGVEKAKVFLNLNAERRGFSRNTPPSSASVTLFMKGGEPVGESLAKAAARMVSGAVRGLAQNQVAVNDGSGNSVLDWDQIGQPGDALSRARLDQERSIREKIRNQLAFDPRAIVNVRVDLNFATETVQSEKPEDPVDISEEISTENRVRDREAPPTGAQANVGVAVNGPGDNEQSTVQTSRVERQAGIVRTTRQTPSGDTFAIFAAISISHTYLESIYKRFNPDAPAPTRQQIDAMFEPERQRIVDQISKLVKATDDRNVTEQISVTYYYDAAETAPVKAGGAMDQGFELATRFGPQAGLGVLALISLMMMFRLSKKSDGVESLGLELGLPKEAIEAARTAAADVQRIAARPGATGAAGAGGGGSGGGRRPPPVKEEPNYPTTSAMEGVLVAQEVDASMVQVSRMLEEVDDFVKADAEGVSALFEQWIDQTEKVRT
ncbi:MAG: hypothetical protein SF069_09965 [Phycisphaerae bacterium]|nr:hypothetical protein [Phycisphaerae bacterium]